MHAIHPVPKDIPEKQGNELVGNTIFGASVGSGIGLLSKMALGKKLKLSPFKTSVIGALAGGTGGALISKLRRRKRNEE